MKKKRVQGWITVPIRFFIDADSKEAFRFAEQSIPKNTWVSMTSSDGYSIRSEIAYRPGEFDEGEK